MSLRFTVPGNPIAWQRVTRHFRTGQAINPKAMRDHEKTVADHADLAIRESWQISTYPVSGSVWLGATFYLGTYVQRGGQRFHDSDLDNLLKLVKDAMRKIVYYDDKQVRGYCPGTKKVLGCPEPHTVIYVIHENEIAPELLKTWATLPGVAAERKDSQ